MTCALIDALKNEHKEIIEMLLMTSNVDVNVIESVGLIKLISVDTF